MFNVLVAEDDVNIRKLTQIKLKNAGFNVITACDGEDALNKFHENHIDIMVVDVMMPKVDGFEFVLEIRKNGDKTPAIMCTALGGINDKAQGFLVGVDDYMVKPVDFDELIMRINAVMRRAKIVNERKIQVKDVILDYDTLSIIKGDVKVVLTKKEFSILYKLISYPDKTFSKSQLFEEFWSYESETEEEAVKVYINKIRNKIQDFKEIDIETIRGLGYKGVRNED